MTTDQSERGSNYGDMIDIERATNRRQSSADLCSYRRRRAIHRIHQWLDLHHSAELNWATWSSLIHGARGVIYFDHSFSGPARQRQSLSNHFQTVQPGQTISIYNQIKTTDALIEQLAPVLNSPFALNYVTVRQSLRLPNYTGSGRLFGGIEVMAKDYNGQFYIFADTRDSETQTNIPATFTIADKNAISVTVVNENRTIPVVNGVFSDTFATAATVHIYQVNDAPSGAPVITSFSPDSGTAGDGITNASTLVLSGTAAANDTLKIFDGSTLLGTATANSSGAWSYTTAALANGSHSFTVTDTVKSLTSPVVERHCR